MKFAKKGTGATTVTYAEALEVALCWGWIDSQARGFDDAAGLLYVRAQNRAQRGMKEMRAGVVAHGRVARFGVDAGDHDIAFLDLVQQLHLVHRLARSRGVGRFDHRQGLAGPL